MEARKFADELQGFEEQLTAFYATFQKSKKNILNEYTAQSGEILKENKVLSAETTRLRHELKVSEDEIYYLKRDLEAAEIQITALQARLDESSSLLTKIGAFARSDISTTRKRERSPDPNLQLKRSRWDDKPVNHLQPVGRYTSDTNPNTGLDHGYSTDDLYNRDTSAETKLGAPVLDRLLRVNESPSNATKVAKYLKNQPEFAFSTMNTGQTASRHQPLHQTPALDRQKKRRLVCHECYAKRAKCDNGTTCYNCEVTGADCVRTLCAGFHSERGCYRPSGDCFKIHDEQGYNTTDYDPYNAPRKI